VSRVAAAHVARPLVAALALSSVLGLAACGSSGIPKAEYIGKVDPICAKYKGEANKITPPQTGDPAALGTYYSQLADLADRQTNEIDGVGRPKEGKAQIEDLLKRQRNQISQLRQLGDAIKANDETKANQIGSAADPEGKKIDADLKAFGFKTCGSA
jgi:hypothetical protein